MNSFKNWYLENTGVQVSTPKPQNWYTDAKDFRVEGGFLRVIKNPQAPTDWSVAMTEVDELQRRQGIATKLIQAMISTVKGSIGAQCSSDGSAELYWKLGFRLPPDNKTFEDALEIRRKMSSVNLIYKG